MTFHVRLVSPADLTEHLVDVLLADSGVSNVVVLAGSARRPNGDAVQFDVRQRGWDEMISLGMQSYELTPVKEAAK